MMMFWKSKSHAKVIHPPTFHWLMVELYPDCPDCGFDNYDAHIKCPNCKKDLIRFQKKIESKNLPQYPTEHYPKNGMLLLEGYKSTYLATAIERDGECYICTNNP